MLDPTMRRRAGRVNLFTRQNIALIHRMLADSRSAPEIAQTLGCTVGTLRVRCSQLGISLRQGARERQPVITLVLSDETFAALNERAKRMGWTESRLASEMIKVIVRDQLYDAVLDVLNEV